MENKLLPNSLIKYWDDVEDDELCVDDIKEKIRVAYALNLCTVSVSRIINDRDQYVMDQEYDAILNNLNLQNMPDDDSLLKILKEILNIITFFRIQEGDKKFIEDDYKAELKTNLSKAVNVAGLIGSISSIGLTNLTNPAAWVGVGLSAASTVGIGYMNYQSGKSQARLKKRKQEWELQRAAIEQLNGLRRELFDTAWRLTKNFDVRDEFRLTETQISEYLSILKDEEDFRRFERLDYIKNKFYAYPPFWYQLGHAANLVARKQPRNEEYYINYARECFRFFISIVKTNLLRDDVIASSCALELCELLDPGKDEEREEIKTLLKDAIKYSGNQNDTLQICAIEYMRLGELNAATRILWRLVNEGYEENYNAELLSLIYYQLYTAELKNENLKPLIANCSKDSNYCMIPVKSLRNGDKEERLEAISYVYDFLRSRVSEDAFLLPLPIDSDPLKFNGYIENRKTLLRIKNDDIVRQIDLMFIREYIGLIFSSNSVDLEKEITDTTNINEWLRSNISNSYLRKNKENFYLGQGEEPFRIRVYRVLSDLFKCIGEFTQYDDKVEKTLQSLIEDYISDKIEEINEFEKIFDLSEYHNDEKDLILNKCEFFDLRPLLEIINPSIQEYYYNKIEEVEDKEEEKRIEALSELEHNIYLFAKDYNFAIPIIPNIGLYNQHESKESIPFTLDPVKFGIEDLNGYENKRRVERDRMEAIISKCNEYRNSVIIDPDKCKFRISGDKQYKEYIQGKSKFNQGRIPVAVISVSKKYNIIFDTRGLYWLERGIGENYRDVQFGEDNVLLLKNKKFKHKGLDMEALCALINEMALIAEDEAIDERKYLNEDWLESKAIKIVKTYTSVATVSKSGLIPFSGVAPLLAIQIAMISSISKAFKLKIPKEKFKELPIAMLKQSTSKVVAKGDFKSLLNYVPGKNTLSLLIPGGSCGAATYALGICFIDYCKDVIKNHNGKIEEASFVKSATSVMQKKFDDLIDVKEKEINDTLVQKEADLSWDLTQLQTSIEEVERSTQQTIQNIKTANKIIVEENIKTEEQMDNGWEEIKKKMKPFETEE